MQIDNKAIVFTVLVFNIQTINDIPICKHFQLFWPLISLPFTDKAKESKI